MLARATHRVLFERNISHITDVGQQLKVATFFFFLQLIPQLLDLLCSALISRHLSQEHSNGVITGAGAYGNFYPAVHVGGAEWCNDDRKAVVQESCMEGGVFGGCVSLGRDRAVLTWPYSLFLEGRGTVGAA